MHLRACATLLACAALGGCSPLARSTVDMLDAVVFGPGSLEVNKAEVEAFPYALLQIDSPMGEALMVFIYERNGRQAWVASSQQVLMLEDGALVRSVGFPQDLDETRFIGTSPFKAGLQNLTAGATFERRLDVISKQRFDIPAYSRFQPRGHEVVDILGKPHELLRVDEDLRADGLGLNVTNRYWVDPQDGFIYASLQYLTPDMPLYLTQIRPPRDFQGGAQWGFPP